MRGAEAQIGTTRLVFEDSGEGGILGWSLRAGPATDIDGLATTAAEEPAPGPSPGHPNGATRLDHVVVLTPDVRRTFAALEASGFDLRRTREGEHAGRPVLQGFYRMGEVILEVVGAPEPPHGESGPAAFWGLVVVVDDLDACAALLGDRLGEVRDAVQPGRRIATVRRAAGLSVPVAFMSA